MKKGSFVAGMKHFFPETVRVAFGARGTTLHDILTYNIEVQTIRRKKQKFRFWEKKVKGKTKHGELDNLKDKTHADDAVLKHGTRKIV